MESLKSQGVKFHTDGLSVRIMMISLFFTNSLAFSQEKQCKAYQVACQSLCSELPLHLPKNNNDKTRHEGSSTMTYEKEGLVNPAAYEQAEQGGVAHLVHGWPMRGHKDEVASQTLPSKTFWAN
jgi:hypothetical protein